MNTRGQSQVLAAKAASPVRFASLGILTPACALEDQLSTGRFGGSSDSRSEFDWSSNRGGLILQFLMKMELSAHDISQFHAFGLELLKSSRSLILQLWKDKSFSTTIKSDATPVTEVDLRAEELLREKIGKQFPNHGILGEEFEHTNPQSEFQWILDPIDGTQNLAHHIPTFGTLIGLRFRNEAVVGFIDHPVLDMLCHGGKGIGAFANGKKIDLPDLPRPELGPQDLISTSTLSVFRRSKDDAVYHALHDFSPNARVYYDCYAHSLTVTGSLVASIDFNLKVWDVTSAEALTRAAGGRFEYLGPAAVADKTTRVSAAFGRANAVEALLPVIRANVRQS